MPRTAVSKQHIQNSYCKTLVTKCLSVPCRLGECYERLNEFGFVLDGACFWDHHDTHFPATTCLSPKFALTAYLMVPITTLLLLSCCSIQLADTCKAAT